MTLQDICCYRLAAQKIADTPFTNPKDLVAHMGAMQAQDFPMARWALGLRLKQATDETILSAVDKGEIIRTHVMRPTWHFVSPDDIYWMLELTAPQIHALSKSRHKQLEITPALISKCNRMFEKAMANGNHYTRDELVSLLVKAKIPLDNNRAAHLLFCAELDEVICSGARKGDKPTYALLAERVPKANRYTREESLAKLAERYVTSHGPATAYDFSWWSGLSVTDSKNAFEMVSSHFESAEINGSKYLFSSKLSKEPVKTHPFALLPAYDEFLIAYRDRTAALPKAHTDTTISINGIFKPLLVVDGRINGIWKRTKVGKKVIVESEFFKDPSQLVKRRFMEAVRQYGQFLGSAIEVVSG